MSLTNELQNVEYSRFYGKNVEYSRFFRFFENIFACPSSRRNFASDSVEGAPSPPQKKRGRDRQAEARTAKTPSYHVSGFKFQLSISYAEVWARLGIVQASLTLLSLYKHCQL